MVAGFFTYMERYFLEIIYDYLITNVLLINRGVQIRSDQIRSDFGTKIYISDRIGLIKLFRSQIGSDFDIRNKMN